MALSKITEIKCFHPQGKSMPNGINYAVIPNFPILKLDVALLGNNGQRSSLGFAAWFTKIFLIPTLVFLVPIAIGM
jgi:hypothetical protein